MRLSPSFSKTHASDSTAYSHMRTGRRYCTIFTPVENYKSLSVFICAATKPPLPDLEQMDLGPTCSPVQFYLFEFSLSPSSPITPLLILCDTSRFLFLISLLASWHQKCGELILCIIIQINDKILDWDKATSNHRNSHPLGRHTRPFIDTLWVHCSH